MFNCSPSGDGVISGHADGKIVRYMFQDEHARVSNMCVRVCVCTIFVITSLQDHYFSTIMYLPPSL